MLFALATAAPARGDTVSGVRALSPAEAEQERLRRLLQGSPGAYVDKVMVPGDLPAGSDDPADAAGDFRSWFSETRAVRTSTTGDTQRARAGFELGQSIGYRQETLNYGDYELLADLRAGDGDTLTSAGPATLASKRQSARIGLRNIAFPVSTRLFADTAVGDTFSELTDAFTRNYRLSLGTRPVRGLSARLYGADFDLRAGTGERGNLAGGPYAGFEPTAGSLSWVGATRYTPLGTLGLQYNHATGAATTAFNARGDETVDSTAAAYRITRDLADGLGLSARLTAIHSTIDSASAGHLAANGWFAEGTVLTDNARQEFGLFDADPQLRFGDGRLFDNRGAYWRIDRQHSALGWGLGVQADAQSADGLSPGSRRIGVQTNAQWQIDRRHAVGGTLSLDQRRFDAPAGTATGERSDSLYATAYYQMQLPRLGHSRFVVTERRNQVLVLNAGTANGEELSWEQDWLGSSNGSGPELSTSLGVARDRQDGVSTLSPTAGLRLTYSPAPRWSLSANLHYTSSRSNLSATQGLSGFADTEYAFDNGWRIGASLNLNQVAVQLGQSPLIPTGSSQLLRTRDIYFGVWARFDGARGNTVRGIGTSDRPAVGAGALAGRVFFDENRDGEQQPQEAGVPGVEVVLDGRFRTTTDSAGRFSFPLVATGVHRVGVRQESVPLPWGAGDAQGWRADVPLRGQATVPIPVVRLGE